MFSTSGVPLVGAETFGSALRPERYASTTPASGPLACGYALSGYLLRTLLTFAARFAAAASLAACSRGTSWPVRLAGGGSAHSGVRAPSRVAPVESGGDSGA